MPSVISLGEALIDFVSTVSGVRVKDAPSFEKAPGGAPANVAVGLAKLGVDTGFIGKVGGDEFGLCLKETLDSFGVDTEGMIIDEEQRTTLAFVSLTADGKPSFAFYRNPGADMMLRPDELNEKWLSTAKIFHFGSISLFDPPASDATRKAIEIAHASGALISYDPNLRPALWKDKAAAFELIREGLASADIVKMSEEEMEELFGTSSLEEGSQRILDQGKMAVLITRGEKGCAVRCADGYAEVDGVSLSPVDTTGAGDGFVAGILRELLTAIELGHDVRTLDIEWWKDAARFANTVAALSIGKKGAIPALPTLDETNKFLEQG